MEEWMQKGAEDWRKNQMIKREREKRELEFEFKETEKFNQLTTKLVEDSNQEVHEGIA